MAGLSQPRPFGEIKIIPIFGTVSKLEFSRISAFYRLPLRLGKLSCPQSGFRRSPVKMVN